MEDIARGAGVGKDTLYRRWSSKEQLAIDLIDTLAAETVRPAPLEADPRFNLLTYLKDVVRFNTSTDFGPLIAGIIGASSRNPDLAASLRAFWDRRRTTATDLLLDVVGHEIDERRLGVYLDQLFGPIYYRLLVTGVAVDDEFLWDLVSSLPWSHLAGPDPH